MSNPGAISKVRAPSRLARIDGDLTTPRRKAVAVHARLRQMIVTGELQPGAILSQAELAQRLGVSRTPLREALRMLQEEGLVGAEPDQRGYVKGFDPQELDELYANRILLETLAVRLTLTRQTRDPRELIQPELIEAKLDDLDEKRRAKSEEWHLAHHAFHLTLSSGCGDPMKRLLASLATQAERFVRIRQLTASSSFRAAGTEHKAIAAAFCDNQPDLAVNLLANHLANTAFAVLADLAGHHEPMAVREALSVARGGAGLSELAEQSAPSLAPDAVTGATSADAFVSIAQGPFKDHGEIL